MRDLSQEQALAGVHRAAIGRVAVVITAEMEQPVNQVESEFVGRIETAAGGLADGRFNGNDNLAGQWLGMGCGEGEGDDVSRAEVIQIGGVESGDGGIIDEADRKIGLVDSLGVEDLAGELTQRGRIER